MVATVCSQWADSWKSLGRKLPLRVRAQRQRRDEQALAGAVADPQCYFPRRVRELQCYARWNLPLDLALELAGQFWLWNQGNFPISLKFRSLFYDCDEEEEITLNLASHSAFDLGDVRLPPSRALWPNSGGRPPRRPRKLLENHGKATLWVKREADLNSFIPVSQLHVKQLLSLAEAVQAQEDATATGTYLFMEQPRELTSQMSDGTRCHWTEGSSKESLEHRMGWNPGDDLEDDAEPMPPGPSYHKWYQQIDLLKTDIRRGETDEPTLFKSLSFSVCTIRWSVIRFTTYVFSSYSTEWGGTSGMIPRGSGYSRGVCSDGWV